LITDLIKASIIDKDTLLEDLQAMRDELDERVKKVEQLVEDLVKIDRAIQRREERAAKYDQ
jgi:CHASE3 domain sensor protein